MLHFKEEENIKVFLNAYVSYSCGMSCAISFILFLKSVRGTKWNRSASS